MHHDAECQRYRPDLLTSTHTDSPYSRVIHPLVPANQGFEIENGFIVIRPQDHQARPKMTMIEIDTNETNLFPNTTVAGRVRKKSQGYRGQIWVEDGKVRHYHLDMGASLSPAIREVLARHRQAMIDLGLDITDSSILHTLSEFNPKCVIRNEGLNLLLGDAVAIDIDLHHSTPDVLPGISGNGTLSDGGEFSYRANNFGKSGTDIRIPIFSAPMPEAYLPDPEGRDGVYIIPPDTPHVQFVVGLRLGDHRFSRLSDQIVQQLETSPGDSEAMRLLVDPYFDVEDLVEN